QLFQLEVCLLTTAISYHQHRNLLGRQSASLGAATAPTRRSRQFALPFEGLQEEGFICFNNA
ncbi:hypothetical protein ACP89_19470, partial [Pseudomonas oleovorans]|nr:hypothetical protein [Pseudomonas oleovorans]